MTEWSVAWCLCNVGWVLCGVTGYRPWQGVFHIHLSRRSRVARWRRVAPLSRAQKREKHPLRSCCLPVEAHSVRAVGGLRTRSTLRTWRSNVMRSSWLPSASPRFVSYRNRLPAASNKTTQRGSSQQWVAVSDGSVRWQTESDFVKTYDKAKSVS